jgi:hypothetical protein
MVVFCPRTGRPPDATPVLGGNQDREDPADGMIKADHRKNLEDAAALLGLAEEMKADLDKEDALIVSARNVRQTEEIERLAKRIRGRLTRE